MNQSISEILKSIIVDLDWVDSASGLVRTIRRSGENKTVKTFPGATNVSPGYDANTITDMVPNSAKMSVVYFEDQGITTKQEGRWIKAESRLRLVAWLNGKKIRFTSSQAVKTIQEVLHSLPVNFSSGDFGQIKIVSIIEETKSAAIFSQYSYNEEQTQYLMFPNDYFSLIITVSYLCSPECFTDTGLVVLDDCGNDVDFDYCEHYEASLSDRQRDCLTITLIDGNTFTENADYGILTTSTS